MAASTRGHSPSRTPPFVLVGLFVILSVLAFKYWSLYSEKVRLQEELDVLSVKAKEMKASSEGKEQIRANLEQQVNTAKKEVEKLNQQKASLEKSIEEGKTDLKNKQTDVEDCQKSLGDCEGNLKTKAQDIERLRGEKEAAEKLLEKERADCAEKLKAAENTCKQSNCDQAVKDILKAIATKVNTDLLRQVLADAGKDHYNLMQGIPENKNTDHVGNNELPVDAEAQQREAGLAGPGGVPPMQDLQQPELPVQGNNGENKNTQDENEGMEEEQKAPENKDVDKYVDEEDEGLDDDGTMKMKMEGMEEEYEEKKDEEDGKKDNDINYNTDFDDIKVDAQ